MTSLTIIAAVAENGVIGAAGGMPWHCPEDLRHFRALTMGKPVIMGRKTWHSLPGKLQGRSNIVVSRRPDAMLTRDGKAPDAACDSFGRALGFALSLVDGQDAPEVCVIGGGEIYRQAMPLATRLHLTRLHQRPDGDVFFPAWDERDWIRVHADERHGLAFEQWERK